MGGLAAVAQRPSKGEMFWTVWLRSLSSPCPFWKAAEGLTGQSPSRGPPRRLGEDVLPYRSAGLEMEGSWGSWKGREWPSRRADEGGQARGGGLGGWR